MLQVLSVTQQLRCLATNVGRATASRDSSHSLSWILGQTCPTSQARGKSSAGKCTAVLVVILARRAPPSRNIRKLPGRLERGRMSSAPKLQSLRYRTCRGKIAMLGVLNNPE